MTLPEGWEVVIGLEVHCELATNTKLFCGCPNKFGGEPNTNVCPTCLGLPGSLPVVNETAVNYAMTLGTALNCSIEPSVFARKNYFYPDMPKDFQTTQFDQPTNVEGFLDLPDGSRCGIERAHIEEDTGKSTHMGGAGRIHDAQYSLVDYNRAGVPLVEIVGKPDIRSAEQARAYVAELREILLATGVSDARMEEGSMRVDANVSVRPVGSDELRTRCEVKNVNSLRSLVRAIEYESARHVDLYDAGEKPKQETRHWDEEGGRTLSGRSKEDSEDYRYFTEPDLIALDPTPEDIAAIQAAMPELPSQRRGDLAAAASVEQTGAVAIAVERGLDTLALDAIGAGADPGRVLTHVEHNLAVEGADRLDAAAFAELVTMETGGDLTATQAKQVLAEMVETGNGPRQIAEAHGFEAMDSGELDSVLDQIIADNADAWAELISADPEADKKAIKKKMGFFTGEVMKATKGQADGKAVNQAMNTRLNAAR
jgi:aspartyl-tRNA(Asn)/glutamyl-tRNA(Gln) amidotransferase subunit B